MKKKLTIIFGAVLLSVILLLMYAQQKGLILPWYITWQDKTVTEGDFTVTLKNKRLKVFKENDCVWELSIDIKAQDFLITDVDRDGNSEITVLCWKKGRFGKKSPFFMEDDKSVYSEHIYVYDLTPNKPVPKWMASDIGPVVLSFESKDGVILTTYEKSGVTSEWQWLDWGFTKIR